MKSIVLGTAGHIDHGKTSLIRALTGIDTDRLPEEKSRGITIELGFAHLQLTPEIRLGIVDVPGHEKFVHHMVAGVGGIDVVLLVVAADEGIMPQTREHIDICNLLGVSFGIVALTKIDMVDPDWLALVLDDTRQYLSGTFLSDAPIINISAMNGTGVDSLKNELIQISEKIHQRSNLGIFRLPADRAFVIKGFGTVITGTVIGGSANLGDKVQLVPNGPDTKIRGLQIHGQKVETICAGQRAAINLQGVSKDEVERGMVLTHSGELISTFITDASCKYNNSASKPLKNRTRIRFYSGTAETLGRIILLDREEIMPGEECLVQFRLESPVTVLPHDRFLLRSYSPVITIGGGTILNSSGPKRRRYQKKDIKFFQLLQSPDPLDNLKAWFIQAGIKGLTRQELRRNTSNFHMNLDHLLDQLQQKNLIVALLSSPPILIDSIAWDRFIEDILEFLKNYHTRHPTRMGIAKEELRSSLDVKPNPVLLNQVLSDMSLKKLISDSGQMVHLIEFAPQLSSIQQKLVAELESLLIESGSKGKSLQEITEAYSSTYKQDLQLIVKYLLEQNRLIKISGALIFHTSVIDMMKKQLTDFIGKTGKISVGEFRDLMDISRKQAIPLMEYFDQINFTKRVGDSRSLK